MTNETEALRRYRSALRDIADAEAIPDDAAAFVWCRDVAIAALDKPETPKLPKGMVPWHGGDSAPKDWDGGPVLLRDGPRPKNGEGCNTLVWSHPHMKGCGAKELGGDIIAYTPKLTPPSDHIASASGEVSAAVYEAAVRGRQDFRAAYRKMMEPLRISYEPSDEEQDVIRKIAADQDLSDTAVMRQALRLYQRHHERLKAGEAIIYSGDAQRSADFAGPLATLSPAQQSGELREAWDDLSTHRKAWRNAIVLARDFACEGGEVPDAERSYWSHELRAFDRVFTALALAATPPQEPSA